MMAKSDVAWHGVCMKSFNVTMPDELLEYVRRRTRDGGFGTPTEFMRDLIRRDRDAQADAEIEKMLLDGVTSPRSRVGERAFFQRMHALIEQVAERARGKGRNGKATRSASRGR
jgi:antitoxin ParD1/3/4